MNFHTNIIEYFQMNTKMITYIFYKYNITKINEVLNSIQFF